MDSVGLPGPGKTHFGLMERFQPVVDAGCVLLSHPLLSSRS